MLTYKDDDGRKVMTIANMIF